LTQSSSQQRLQNDLPVASADSGRGRVAGYICIAAATLFWGISATLGRAVFTGRMHIFGQVVAPIPPLMLAQSRTTFAFVMMFPLLAVFRGACSLKLTPRDAFDSMLVGSLGIAASNFFYYYAIQQTSVATAIILQYLAPAMVLIWMVARRLQSPSPQRLLGVMFAIAGSVLAIGVVVRSEHFPGLTISAQDVNLNFRGVSAALLAAVAFSFYNIFGQHLVARHNRWTVLLWALAGAAVGWLLVTPPWRVVAAHYSSAQWTFMALFSMFSVMVPFSLYFWGLQFLDPTRAIVTSCLEPVFAILIAALALGETVNKIQIAGIVVTLAATVLVQLPERNRGTLVFEPME
jgi:drug/metabolite transporter (DMT)-like permease